MTLIELCTEQEARRITDEIRYAAERVWELLMQAHDRHAWAALGYPTFAAYASAEFGMSKVHAYRLVGQGHVVQAIEEASGVTHGLLDVSEREARDLKGHLGEVANSVREAIAEVQGDDVPEAEVVEIVRDVVERERERIRSETRTRLERLPPDLNNRVITGGYELDQAESVDRERSGRLDVWAQNLREAMRRLARMAGSPVPDALQERLTDPELAVLTTILTALGEGDYGFLE